MENLDMQKTVMEALREIFDPEIPVNIYDLGLIYEIDIRDHATVYIQMTLTSPNCPVAESLPQEVYERVKAIDGVKEVEIELTFEPPWDSDMMTEAAKLDIGLL
ncbi:MAG: SUF system Fe-S cluster assembly protein [Bacteroidales bacterium]|nr:SUF system Fe-S cluster assembly protein [Bacteroidales bacterium]